MDESGEDYTMGIYGLLVDQSITYERRGISNAPRLCEEQWIPHNRNGSGGGLSSPSAFHLHGLRLQQPPAGGGEVQNFQD